MLVRKVRSAVCAAVAGLACALVAGCAGGQEQPKTGAEGAAAGGDQVAQGQALYAEKCASCHGAQGQGASGPPVVGKGALPLAPPAGAKYRSEPFHTAGDVYDFVKKNMPANAPGTLTDAETSAIIAFDLKANGVDLAGKHIDHTSAAAITLHP